MKTTVIFLVFLTLFLGCNYQPSLFSSKQYKEEVEAQYWKILEQYPAEITDSIREQGSKFVGEKLEAYQFLYAFMPIGDMADYPANFYAKIVDKSFEARTYFQWGETVPNDLFLHFVLPYRVNNEDLDSSRSFFLSQLQERIQEMSMLDAAMEVNHWCHEHVAYQSSDDRTRSPLATYNNGYGRCGEESTFTVAALRSVGIPARQVYTPRWAHVDDNHAWVEFWAEGKWYFFGACEPMAEPNQAWFSEPAKRAMVVNTKVYGNYEGSEEIIESYDKYKIINTLAVYANTKTLQVKVVDAQNKVVPEAEVSFQLYNYAEFYTLSRQMTNSDGMAFFTTGMGDLWVWAKYKNLTASKLISVAETDTLILQLAEFKSDSTPYFVQVHCPVASQPVVLNAEKQEINAQRLIYEDSIRAAYERGFVDSIQAYQWASELKISPERLWPLLKKSRSNHGQIIQFLKDTDSANRTLALDLLEVILLKDLNDTPAKVLTNHLMSFVENRSAQSPYNKLTTQYVLNPRLGWEMISPWRGQLKAFFIARQCNTPSEIIGWIRDSIQLGEERMINHSGNPVSPLGVLKIRWADSYSRDLLIIASLRDHGYPARFEEGTQRVQYYEGVNWLYADLVSAENDGLQLGNLVLHQAQSNAIMPLYYKHFTIAQWKNGAYKTLEFEWDKPLNAFPENLKLPAGNYRALSGSRNPDGSVMLWYQNFELKAGATTHLQIVVRDTQFQTSSMGLFDLSTLAKPYAQQNAQVLPTSWKILVWIDPAAEPSRHVMEDLKLNAKLLQSRGMQLWILTSAKHSIEKLDPQYFSGLPLPHFYTQDAHIKSLKEISKTLGYSNIPPLPLVVLLDNENQIIYKNHGYKIGVANELLAVMVGEKQCKR